MASEGVVLKARDAVAAPRQAAAATPNERLLRSGLALAALLSAWAVDTSALAAFDAPKRLGVLVCFVAVASLASWRGAWPQPRGWSTAARVAAMATGCAVLAMLLSTAASPHPAVAQEALRSVALWLLPIVFAACLRRRPDRGWLGASLALAIGSSAVMSLLQSAGFTLGLELTQLSGRYPTGALLGNEGYVALACALALPACLHAWLVRDARRVRVIAACLALACIAAIVVNRQATAAIAALAGCAVVVALHWRAGRAVLVGAGAAAVLVLSLALPAVRSVAWEPLLGSRLPALQQATTWRLGAWAAAESMWRERPLLGHGPGTYAILSLPHRLQSELRARERLTPPVTATHFVQAHDEYLQLAAEAGLVALAGVLIAFGVILRGLSQRARAQSEAAMLAGVLVSGAVAALAWFPLQIPLTALILLVAAGRGWRVVADTDADATPAGATAPPRGARDARAKVLRVAACVALLLAAWPELARYRVERHLADASHVLGGLLQGDTDAVARLPGALDASDRPAYPGDHRAALLHGLALLLSGRAEDARLHFESALAIGEHPEIVLNLGRARAATGDERGARVAFVRSAWAAPSATATLPATMRAWVSSEVATKEADLRAGRLSDPPPLR